MKTKYARYPVVSKSQGRPWTRRDRTVCKPKRQDPKEGPFKGNDVTRGVVSSQDGPPQVGCGSESDGPESLVRNTVPDVTVVEGNG